MLFRSGRLDEAALDLACERILKIAFRYAENKISGTMNLDQDSALAKRIAEQSMVLLKNDGALPLARNEKILFVGPFAKAPRYQGGGSSKTKSIMVKSALDAAGESVDYLEGFSDLRLNLNGQLLREVLDRIASYEKVVVFAGLPEIKESEGYDRKTLELPEYQNHAIAAIAAVCANTSVVLYNGSPVEMPWISQVNAVLEGYLGGQEAGPATVSLLFGDENPSGRLAETFPLRLEDNPSYLYYFGEDDRVEYREGVFVGYRYYESKKAPVLFPFGFGLSYTQFACSNLRISQKEIDCEDSLQVSVDVTNTGTRSGREVVQLYVAPHKGGVIRPVRELKGFAKVKLEPGETQTVKFTLTSRSFAYWNMALNNWHVESGHYDIEIRKNARDGLLSDTVRINSRPVIAEVTEMSLISDFIKTKTGSAFWAEIMPALTAVLARMFPEMHEQRQEMENLSAGESQSALLLSQPISMVQRFMGIDDITFKNLIDEINKEFRQSRQSSIGG